MHYYGFQSRDTEVAVVIFIRIGNYHGHPVPAYSRFYVGLDIPEIACQLITNYLKAKCLY